MEELDDEIEYLSEEELAQALALCSFTNTHFVYFEENGDITSITNEKKPGNSSYIEYRYEDVKEFLTGKINLLDYRLILNTKHEPVIIKKTAEADYVTYSFKVIEPYTKDPVILVVWNKTEKMWHVSINKQMPVYSGINSTLSFFVTFEKNIDFLIRSFHIEMKDLITKDVVDIPFTSKFEDDIESILLTTGKFVHSYGLEIHE
jgi:hypothetical protein